MTAITPTYAHAYQSICYGGTSHGGPLTRNFAYLQPKPNIRIFPTLGATTREKGNDFHGWAIYTDGGTRSSDGETLAGWGVVGRSPHGRIYLYIGIMFGPVITTEAHLAYCREQNPLQQHR